MYPYDEKNNRITGEAVVLVLVGPKGKVTDVSVLQSSGNDALDRAAREALRKWRYEPLIEDGVAGEFVSIQRMNFTLTVKEK